MDPLLQSNGKRPRRGAVLVCPKCGDSFYASPANVERRKYCSRACKEADQSHQQSITCEQCGREFDRAQSRGGRFCSWECYGLSRPTRTECGICGGPLPYQRRQYCSTECRLAARRTGEFGACQQCGAQMYLEPGQVGKKRFCSRECADKSKEIDGPGCVIRRQDGYIGVYYPKHPDVNRDGFILQHRLVAEEKYGRRILPSEHVHHLNGIRDDNRPENLEVISPSDHARESIKQGKAKRKSMRERLAEYEKRYGPLD